MSIERNFKLQVYQQRGCIITARSLMLIAFSYRQIGVTIVITIIIIIIIQQCDL
jgi:hypothetical protein